MKRSITLIWLLVLLFMFIKNGYLSAQDKFIWGKQLGTDKEEYALNHVTDKNGNIYISGKTTGVMDNRNFGKNDGFITKIDSSGNIQWSKQFGSNEEEDVLWSAIDSKGNVYITGSTTGSLEGKNLGKEDIFVVKYTPDGFMQWAKQFGTDSTDIGQGIYADNNGFIYVTGTTRGILGQAVFGKSDGFVMKLDSNGNQLFIRQFGTTGDDNSVSITGDGKSRLYVSGSTWGDMAAKNKGMIDAFVGVFTDQGKKVKFIQFGSEGFDIALQIITDSEKNIYIGGSTSGNLEGEQLGEGDCFLTKINPGGDIAWTRQFGTKNHDGIRGIDLNNKISANILVSGICNLPPAYSFIRMYTKNGSLLWERTFNARGINGDTSGKDVSLDDNGNIYHMGLTAANLFGSSLGGPDVYLVKLGLNKCYMNP